VHCGLRPFYPTHHGEVWPAAELWHRRFPTQGTCIVSSLFPTKCFACRGKRLLLVHMGLEASIGACTVFLQLKTLGSRLGDSKVHRHISLSSFLLSLFVFSFQTAGHTLVLFFTFLAPSPTKSSWRIPQTFLGVGRRCILGGLQVHATLIRACGRCYRQLRAVNSQKIPMIRLGGFFHLYKGGRH